MQERRQHYRKNLSSAGHLIEADGIMPFELLNLSMGGCEVRFEACPDVEPGSLVRLRLPDLSLSAAATVAWISPDGDGTIRAGFEFEHVKGEGENAYLFEHAPGES